LAPGQVARRAEHDQHRRLHGARSVAGRGQRRLLEGPGPVRRLIATIVPTTARDHTGMDAGTVAIYEEGATRWAAARPAMLREDAVEFAAGLPAGVVRADLGCGPGKYTGDLGTPVVAFDAAHSMLTLARGSAPQAWAVQGDLEHLPFRTGALGGGWARASYLHVPRPRLPLALADLQRATAVGAPGTVTMKRGDYEGGALRGDDFPGGFCACWEPEPLVEVFEGAGFTITDRRISDEWTHLTATRARTLPDYVGPGLRVVVCGLNPSLHAADAGVGYAGPGNRFW